MSDYDENDKYNFSSDGEEASDASILNPLAEALLDRSTALVEEIELFQRSLRQNNLEKKVELRLFLNQVKSEYRSLQGLALETPGSKKSRHGVHCSNLPYLEAVWLNAKKSNGITALFKSFGYSDPGSVNNRGKKGKASVTVDIVAQNGLEWIKVSLITPRRLLFELAKAGWEEFSDSSSDSEESAPSLGSAPLAVGSTSLSQLADHLLLASRQTRIQYLHPAITFILPCLCPSSPEIEAVISHLTAKGITVVTGTGENSSLIPAPSIPEVISSLSSPLSRRATPLSDTLNLDTTILLAMISDISHHSSVTPEPRFHPAILRQLEFEAAEPMMDVHLMPVLKGRKLITAESARERFDEIVSIVASETERERAHLLLSYPDDNSTSTLSPEARIKRFQELSCRNLEGLKLPVETVVDEPGKDQEVALKLSVVNRGAFMTGWQRDVTTVTSNRAVAKVVAAACQGMEQGPDVMVVMSARSLVGKGKIRVGVDGKLERE
ncbi:hypothetical protein BZA77DRAFT_322902 [Pyronema omphalodes]|nr:hypothetical protein BZA77DRAFT_322902 [Pyronema omphalodes]